MKKLLNLVKSLFLFILYLVYNSIIVELINIIFNTNVKLFSNTNKLIILFACDITLILIFYMIYKKSLKEDFIDFKKNFGSYMFKGVIVWAISVVLMMITNMIISSYVGNIATNEQLVQSTIKIFPLYMLFSSVIYAPFIEELIFRKSIRSFIDNKIIYILTSGFLFGFIHIIANIENKKELLFTIPYALVGSAFAYIYSKTNNVFVSMTLHAIHNAIVVAISILTIFYAF